MDILDVARLLPQKPPILMLDRVVDIEAGVSGVGKRLFRAGDACFQGHFPWRPMLPGALTIEAMAQTALVVMLAEYHEELAAGPDLPLGYLARVNDMSFHRPIEPGQEIYEGQLAGIHSRDNDLVINPTKGKKLDNMRASGKDETIQLVPPVKFTLEQALEFIDDDELVEVTPKSIRLRKKVLNENERKRASKN